MKLTVLLITAIVIEATTVPFVEETVKDKSSRLDRIDQYTLPPSRTNVRLVKRSPLPPGQDGKIKEWSTSRKEGWQGSKDNPVRSGSPQRPPPPDKPPVSIYAAAKGPVRLEVIGSQRPPKRTVYKVPIGKTFQKEFQDPKKLRIDGSVGQQTRQDGKSPRRGRIQLSSTGGKSYTAIDGKLEKVADLKSIGPGITSKRGRFETFEVDNDHKELVYYSKPLRKTDIQGETYQGGSIRNSSKDGQITTAGTLCGNSNNPMITARASNSPSHSPPPSPGKPIPRLEHIWPPYLDKIGYPR